jgi:multidrug efflux pump subunit AcrB
MHIADDSMHMADVDTGMLGGIGGSCTTGTVTSNVSKAIASLAKAWSGKNVTIGQAGVSQQLTESIGNWATAMLVAIGLVCLLTVILVHSLLDPR